jgi:hypothetical protein
MKHVTIIVVLSTIVSLYGCEQQSGGPHAVSTGIGAKYPNVAILALATPLDDRQSARAEAYGTFTTLARCEAERQVYLKAAPAKFAKRGVDFVCIVDAYDPSEDAVKSMADSVQGQQ